LKSSYWIRKVSSQDLLPKFSRDVWDARVVDATECYANRQRLALQGAVIIETSRLAAWDDNFGLNLVDHVLFSWCLPCCFTDKSCWSVRTGRNWDSIYKLRCLPPLAYDIFHRERCLGIISFPDIEYLNPFPCRRDIVEC
jgi:hypothetical protein